MAEERNSATVHENAIRRVLEAEKEAARIIKEVREGAAKKEESIQNPILSQGKNEEGNWFQSLVTAISGAFKSEDAPSVKSGDSGDEGNSNKFEATAKEGLMSTNNAFNPQAQDQNKALDQEENKKKDSWLSAAFGKIWQIVANNKSGQDQPNQGEIASNAPDRVSSPIENEAVSKASSGDDPKDKKVANNSNDEKSGFFQKLGSRISNFFNKVKGSNNITDNIAEVKADPIQDMEPDKSMSDRSIESGDNNKGHKKVTFAEDAKKLDGRMGRIERTRKGGTASAWVKSLRSVEKEGNITPPSGSKPGNMGRGIGG